MELIELPLSKISPSAFQPRETFPKEELEELAESMKEFGLLNPILVRKNGDGTYQIIAGERRWRAAQLAKMKNIMAFVKETTDERQRLESLIENVHRKDLNVIEKGRGMMEIFKVFGLDLKPKEIANKINTMTTRKDSSAIDADEIKISNILKKTHVKPRVIRQWLESISAEPKIIEDYLKTPEEERISEDIIARVSTIKEPELQKRTYEKIKKDEMSAPKASKFVSQIKKLPPKMREAVLTTDIPIEIIGDQEVGYDIEIPEEEIAKLREAVVNGEKETASVLAQEIVQERGRHRRNWQSHNQILAFLDNLFCPYCGKSASSHMRWICHSDHSIDDAKDQAKDNFEESTKRKEPDPRFLKT